MSIGTRNRWIDTLRGIAILLVLLHHFGIAYPLHGSGFGARAVHAVFRNGNYGVTMFFVISGFLITGNAMRRWGSLREIGLRDFYRMRMARILPCLLLLLAVVNGLALAGVPIFANRPSTGVPLWQTDLAALTLWMNVLTAQAGWPNYVLCVLWSLSVEEVFYLAFPLLGRVLRPRAFVAVLLALFVAGPLWRAGHQGDEGGFLYAYLACFDGIAVGCGAALLRWDRPALRMPRGTSIGVGFGMAALYLCASIGTTNVLGVTAMALGTAVLLLAHGPGRGLGLAWLGRRSYELYLFHLLVLGLLRNLLPPAAMQGDSRIALLAAYGAGSVALAWAVARFYSEPLNRALRGAPVNRALTSAA